MSLGYLYVDTINVFRKNFRKFFLIALCFSLFNYFTFVLNAEVFKVFSVGDELKGFYVSLSHPVVNFFVFLFYYFFSLLFFYLNVQVIKSFYAKKKNNFSSIKKLFLEQLVYEKKWLLFFSAWFCLILGGDFYSNYFYLDLFEFSLDQNIQPLSLWIFGSFPLFDLLLNIWFFSKDLFPTIFSLFPFIILLFAACFIPNIVVSSSCYFFQKNTGTKISIFVFFRFLFCFLLLSFVSLLFYVIQSKIILYVSFELLKRFFVLFRLFLLPSLLGSFLVVFFFHLKRHILIRK